MDYYYCNYRQFQPEWSMVTFHSQDLYHIHRICIKDFDLKRIAFVMPEMILNKKLEPTRLMSSLTLMSSRNASSNTKVNMKIFIDYADENQRMFIRTIDAIDDYAIHLIKTHGRKWFGEESRYVVDNIDTLFESFILPGGEMPDMMVFMLKRQNGMFSAKFYWENGDEILNPLEQVKPYSRVRLGIELSCIQYVKYTCKVRVVYKVVEVKVLECAPPLVAPNVQNTYTS